MVTKSTYKEESKAIAQELEEISPALLKLKQSKADDVPFRYFDTLTDNVLNKIQDQQSGDESFWQRWIQLFTTKRRYVLALASIMLLAVITTLIMIKPTKLEDQLAKLDSNEINSYLMNHADDLDEDQLTKMSIGVHTATIATLSDEELNSVLDEYLYQSQNDAN